MTPQRGGKAVTFHIPDDQILNRFIVFFQQMHDLYVCHLAVVDLLGGFLATVPVLVGYIQLIADVGHVFLIPCFVSALSTLSLNLMATIIVNILRYWLNIVPAII